VAKQTADSSLQKVFATCAKELADNESKVLQDLIDCQGSKVDIGGYYRVNKEKTDKAMNPSETLNDIIARLQQGPDARV